MADFSQRDRTSSRREFVLNTPTNSVEIQKAIRVAELMIGDRGDWDDDITVEVGDDEVVLSYDLDKYPDLTCSCGDEAEPVRSSGGRCGRCGWPVPAPETDGGADA